MPGMLCWQVPEHSQLVPPGSNSTKRQRQHLFVVRRATIRQRGRCVRSIETSSMCLQCRIRKGKRRRRHHYVHTMPFRSLQGAFGQSRMRPLRCEHCHGCRGVDFLCGLHARHTSRRRLLCVQPHNESDWAAQRRAHDGAVRSADLESHGGAHCATHLPAIHTHGAADV